MAGVLLKGGCVLSLDKRVGNLHDADVLVEDGIVAEVGRGLRGRDVEVVDATGTIVMPGLVDAHRHLWRSLFRGLGVSDAGRGAPPDAGELGPDEVYAGTLLGLLGAVEAGTTTVVDHADLPDDPSTVEAAIQAHVDAGVRTVLAHAPPVGDGPGTEAVRSTVAARGVLVGPATTLALGWCGPVGADQDGLAARWSLARELGLRLHAHAGTQPSERGAVAAMAARGLLGREVTLAHATHLGGEDLDAVRAHGASVVLSPSTELAAGLGVPPVQDLIDRGLRPGLAVGDESLAPVDVFTQMRAVQSLQRAASFERKLAGKAGVPNLLGTREVIRYATVDGAAAAGLGEVTGSLSPGKRADLVVLRIDRPNIAPVNDPIGAVVWGIDASNVDLVVVDGRVLVRGGVLDADVARVRALVAAAQQRLDVGRADLVETGEGGSR